MFKIFKKKQEEKQSQNFVMNENIEKKINFLLIKFNSSFNRELYDKEKYNLPEKAYELFWEIRSSWKWVNYILEKFLELYKEYPNWPYLIYEIWYSYALMWDFEKAKIYYDKLLKLEERWFFNAITELFTINKILSNDFDKNLFKKYIELFDTPIGAVLEKECEKLLTNFKNFSPIYIPYILSLLINKKIEKLDKVFEDINLLELDFDTKAQIKILDYINNLYKWSKNNDLLKWVYSLKTSMWIDYLADFVLSDLS